MHVQLTHSFMFSPPSNNTYMYEPGYDKWVKYRFMDYMYNCNRLYLACLHNKDVLMI